MRSSLPARMLLPRCWQELPIEDGLMVDSSVPRPFSHVMSVDVEDYFQVEAFAGSISRSDWERFPTRVEANTHLILDLFDEHGARGTFFLVGWVAERFPSLVREIVARGHEPACHSYWHRTDRKSTRLNSSHGYISYAVFCLKKKKI